MNDKATPITEDVLGNISNRVILTLSHYDKLKSNEKLINSRLLIEETHETLDGKVTTRAYGEGKAQQELALKIHNLKESEKKYKAQIQQVLESNDELMQKNSALNLEVSSLSTDLEAEKAKTWFQKLLGK